MVLIKGCPKCHQEKCLHANTEILGWKTILVCSVCRKAWLEGDNHFVDTGKDAIDKLRCRAKQIELDERYHRFMESDSDELWERVL